MQIHFDLKGILCLIFANISIFNTPLLIKIATIVSIIALLAGLFTFATIIYNRVQKQRLRKAESEAEILITDELNDHILTYDSISDIPENELNQSLQKLDALKNKSAVFKQVLIRVLVYFKHNLTGNITQSITSAYQRLNLKEATLSKLNSALWFTKAQGLKELQEINDGDAAQSINALTANKHIEVRIEAYSALQKIHAPNAFDFLKTEEEELSNWHQILLFSAITNSGHEVIPEFRNYFDTQNKSVILLSIKLILHYKQFESVPALISLLSHKNEIIRNQAICALGVLDATEAEEKLISIYPTERNKNKSQILLAIGNIASGNALSFIRDKFLKADHYSILKSAAAAIMAHPANLKDKILSGLTNIDDEQKAMIKHFEDPLIRLHGVY